MRVKKKPLGLAKGYGMILEQSQYSDGNRSQDPLSQKAYKRSSEDQKRGFEILPPPTEILVSSAVSVIDSSPYINGGGSAGDERTLPFHYDPLCQQLSSRC